MKMWWLTMIPRLLELEKLQKKLKLLKKQRLEKPKAPEL
jgi:hypothetical protein